MELQNVSAGDHVPSSPDQPEAILKVDPTLTAVVQTEVQRSIESLATQEHIRAELAHLRQQTDQLLSRLETIAEEQSNVVSLLTTMTEQLLTEEDTAEIAAEQDRASTGQAEQRTILHRLL